MRIHRFFSGELRTALKTFDFMVLEENEFWGWDLPLPLGELEDEDLEEDLGRGPSEAEIEDILEKINEMGEDKQVLQMFFEMVLLQLFNEVGNEQTIREWGWSFSDKAPKAFEALKKIYTGKKKHRLSQEAKWFLFPDE
jgi:hypothetical protein